MNPDPLAIRVARRHARESAVVFRDVPDKFRIEYTNSGRISAVALAKMLAPPLGFIPKLVFHRPVDVPANVIAWEALTEDANVVTGKLVLHAAVAEDEVTSWAEVTVDTR